MSQSSTKTLDQILAQEKKEDDFLPVFIPELNVSIKIAELRFQDLVEIMREKDPFSKVIKTLLLSWGRADPSVTEKKLAQLPALELSEISNAIAKSIEISTKLMSNSKVKRR
jgi:hypothetical protein